MERRMVRICRAGDQLSKKPNVSKMASIEGEKGPCLRTLQDIEADAAELVDVGVEDFGEEANLGGRHGVVFGEKQLELEDAACIIR